MIPLRDDQGRWHPAPVTAVLMLLWVGLWVLLLLSDGGRVDWIERHFGLCPAYWREGWRQLGEATAGDFGWIAWALIRPLFGAQLLHGSVVYCLSNVLFFWVFASRIEERVGWLRYLMFLLLAALLTGLFYVVFSSDPEHYATGGSGLVAAVMSAHLLLYPRARSLILLPVVVVPVLVEIRTFVLIAMWIGLQLRPISRLLDIGPAEPLDWAAHVGGALAGLLLAPLLLRRKKPRSGRSRAWSR